MEPIVLIPGLLCTEALYASQVSALKAHDILVPNHRTQDSISAIAAEILAQAPERFALAGLSMGGYISMEIMRTAPERVSRLCLLDTTAQPDLPEQTQRRHSLMKMALQRDFDKVIELLYPGLVHPARLEDAALKATTRQMALDTGVEGFIHQMNAIINRVDSRPSLTEISCPTTIVVGAQDALTPPDRATEMHQLVRGSKLEVIEDCGHLATLEKPESVNRVLKTWLED